MSQSGIQVTSARLMLEIQKEDLLASETSQSAAEWSPGNKEVSPLLHIEPARLE